ncbi:MAG: hypothetical protein MZU97_07420 [Bacillus subtilis]|nr:hypothetical protein [Bacillus subtilis]
MNTQKPTLFQVIAWMTLVSGVVNLFWGFAASGTALATIIGVICTPLTILPAVLGVFELIYAAKLFSDPPQAVQPSTNIAVFEIASVLTGNVFSMAVGILALVFYNDKVVKDYFARLNGTLRPEPRHNPHPPQSLNRNLCSPSKSPLPPRRMSRRHLPRRKPPKRHPPSRCAVRAKWHKTDPIQDIPGRSNPGCLVKSMSFFLLTLNPLNRRIKIQING